MVEILEVMKKVIIEIVEGMEMKGKLIKEMKMEMKDENERIEEKINLEVKE